MSKMLWKTLIIAAVAAMLGACAGTPHLDRHWGRSVETAKKIQVVNPNADRPTAPSSGMDGRVAGQAVDSYQRSFSNGPKP